MVELKINKTKNKTYEIICLSCKITTEHKVLNSINEKGSGVIANKSDEIYSWNSDYEIVQCLGCKTISFRTELSNSEDYDEDGFYTTELIYPKRTEDSWNIKNFYNVPSRLRRIYRETIDCYNGDCLTLCGAGTRALVEGLCKENGIEDGEVEYKKEDGTIVKKRLDNLQGKIKWITRKRKINKG